MDRDLLLDHWQLWLPFGSSAVAVLVLLACGVMDHGKATLATELARLPHCPSPLMVSAGAEGWHVAGRRVHLHGRWRLWSAAPAAHVGRRGPIGERVEIFGVACERVRSDGYRVVVSDIVVRPLAGARYIELFRGDRARVERALRRVG